MVICNDNMVQYLLLSKRLYAVNTFSFLCTQFASPYYCNTQLFYYKESPVVFFEGGRGGSIWPLRYWQMFFSCQIAQSCNISKGIMGQKGWRRSICGQKRYFCTKGKCKMDYQHQNNAKINISRINNAEGWHL